MNYWEYKFYYAGVLTRCFLMGCVSMFKKSTWRWMQETKEEEGLSWAEVIGIVFWNDYRLEKHFEKEDSY